MRYERVNTVSYNDISIFIYGYLNYLFDLLDQCTLQKKNINTNKLKIINQLYIIPSIIILRKYTYLYIDIILCYTHHKFELHRHIKLQHNTIPIKSTYIMRCKM